MSHDPSSTDSACGCQGAATQPFATGTETGAMGANPGATGPMGPGQTAPAGWTPWGPMPGAPLPGMAQATAGVGAHPQTPHHLGPHGHPQGPAFYGPAYGPAAGMAGMTAPMGPGFAHPGMMAPGMAAPWAFAHGGMPGASPAGHPAAHPGAMAVGQPHPTQAAAFAWGTGWFDFRNEAFVKGLMVGALGAVILSNPTVQKKTMQAMASLWALMQGGVEELKERFQDVEAELQAASRAPAGAAPAADQGADPA